MTKVYRRFGAIGAWIYCRLGLSPNAVSLVSSLFSTTGAIILLTAPSGQVSPSLAITSFLLMAIGYASDCSDGQLARVTGQTSPLGKWLDHVSDAWKMILVNLVLGWVTMAMAITAGTPLHWPFLAMGLNLAGNLLYFFGWNYKVMIAGDNLIAGKTANKRRAILMKLPLQLTEHGVFLFLVLCLPSPEFLWIYLAYGAYQMAICTAYLIASARAMNER